MARGWKYYVVTLWRHRKDGSFHWSHCTFCRRLRLEWWISRVESAGDDDKYNSHNFAKILICQDETMACGVRCWTRGQDGLWRIVFWSFDSHQSGHTSYTHEMRDTVLSFDPYQIDHHLDWNRAQFVNSLFVLNILFLMRDMRWHLLCNQMMNSSVGWGWVRILVSVARHCVTPGPALHWRCSTC